ncbi:MAG TPA: DUF3857 domain-containing protein, partial [Bacteroidales bacterium]|nr:DUF3857 domain-containing protein [Bacteroidales bacterium]
GLKGQTFNVTENGKIVKSKTSGSDIKEVDVDNKNRKMIISLPDVKVGSVIEYKYTIVSLDLVKLRDWYFQTTIPTIWSEFRVSVPFKLNYLVTYQKGKPLSLDDQKNIADRIQWLYDNKLKKIHSELYDKGGVLYDSPTGAVTVNFVRDKTLRYVMRNLPALKIEEGTPLADASQRIKVHLYRAEGMFPFYYDYILETANEEFDNWDISDMRMNRNRRGYIAYWLPTWDEMNNKWLKSDDLGLRMVKAFDYKPMLDIALQGNASGEQLARNIFEVVTNNVKWNGNYGIYADKDFDKVIKRKEGSGPDMNMIMAFLLKRAGFSTDLVLVKTKDKGRLENIYPEKDQFNHVIVQLVIDDKVYYLDATGQNPSFGKLPANVAGTEGWLLRKENYGWVNLQDAGSATQITTI